MGRDEFVVPAGDAREIEEGDLKALTAGLRASRDMSVMMEMTAPAFGEVTILVEKALSIIAALE